MSSYHKNIVWLHSADYKKSSTEKGSSRYFGFLFFLNFILAMPKALYACTNKSKTALILITNKTVDKKSSHNPYMQDYAKIFCTVFNWFLVLAF